MSSLEPGRLLYHGSSDTVASIDLSKGEANRDFGRGFYTTTVKIQAEKFASIKAKRSGKKFGVVSVYAYTPCAEVHIREFAGADFEWLTYVIVNRKARQANPLGGYDAPDVVIGPVADDEVGLVLNQFLLGTYGPVESPDAWKTAVRLLDTEKLYNQVFFATPLAVSCLTYKEAYEVAVDRRRY
jgi:hypothetical protein